MRDGGAIVSGLIFVVIGIHCVFIDNFEGSFADNSVLRVRLLIGLDKDFFDLSLQTGRFSVLLVGTTVVYVVG